MALTVLRSKKYHVPGLGFVVRGVCAFVTTSQTGEIPVKGLTKIEFATFGDIVTHEGMFLDEAADTSGIVTPVAGSVTVGRTAATSGSQFFFKLMGH